MGDTPQTSTSSDWGNYWQGRAATEAGAALVGVGVETHSELVALWEELLAPLSRETPLLDVATGAGTVLRTASAMGFSDLTGLDISEAALATLSRELPEVATVVASASSPPFPEKRFGAVTSQFGLEYAGVADAARALAPLVRDGGRFLAICHLADGAIAKEVSGKLASADAIVDSRFIPIAKDVFAASDTDFPQVAERFGSAQDAVIGLAKSGDRLAAQLYAGTQQLHQRRAAYELSDITGWLDGMAAEIEAFRGRMRGMLDAALDTADVDAVQAILAETGFAPDAPHVLDLGGKPAAILLAATR